MSDSRQSPLFHSSAASVRLDDDSNKIKNHVKELLKARIFLGRYLERRLVNVSVGYRDVVVISPAETDLKRDLLDALHKLRSVCNHWVGITDTVVVGGSTSGVCLWTEIEHQPFGPFWFQIKTIKFRDQEVMIGVKCLRHISEAFLEIEPILTGGAGGGKKTDTTEDKSVLNSVSLNETYTEIVESLRTGLSISNFKELITFFIAFIIAVFTGSTAFVNFIGNFVLALIREMSIFIKNSTPVFLGVLDFFSKIVGGFYILLAMVFRQSTPAPSNQMYGRQPIAYSRKRVPSNTYDDRRYDDRNFD